MSQIMLTLVFLQTSPISPVPELQSVCLLIATLTQDRGLDRPLDPTVFPHPTIRAGPVGPH